MNALFNSVKNFPAIIVMMIAILVLPQSALARDNTGALIGVGLAALLGGALLGAASSSQPTPPPQPQPIQWQAPPAPHVPTLFEKAQAGNLAAQLQVARNYASGNGLKQNDTLAYNWYSKAASQGSAEGMREVGITLAEGRGGIEKNEVEALEWLTKAAEKGDAIAAYQLGHFYKDGIAVPKNDEIALIWYYLAAKQGNVPAADVIKEYASQGNQDAQNDLGNLYSSGSAVEQDDSQAITWYKLAAKQGDPYAQANLADMYSNGKGSVVNYKEAARWMRYSAQQGNPQAQAKLGLMYTVGRGVSIDKHQAYKWLSLASVQMKAQNTNPDLVKAIKSSMASIEADLPAADIASAQNEAQKFEVKSYSKEAMQNFEQTEIVKAWFADYWQYIASALVAILMGMMAWLGMKRAKLRSAEEGHRNIHLTVVSSNAPNAPPQEKICIACNSLIRAKAEMCPKCGVFQDAAAFSKTASRL